VAVGLFMAGNMDVPGTSVSSNNTSQKVFIRNDKISELVNDSDSNGGNFSEQSDDTCEINSPFGSSSSGGNGEFTHLPQQIKQEKNRTGDVL
jgi:hypothetical protein